MERLLRQMFGVLGHLKLDIVCRKMYNNTKIAVFVRLSPREAAMGGFYLTANWRFGPNQATEATE